MTHLPLYCDAYSHWLILNNNWLSKRQVNSALRWHQQTTGGAASAWKCQTTLPAQCPHCIQMVLRAVLVSDSNGLYLIYDFLLFPSASSLAGIGGAGNFWQCCHWEIQKSKNTYRFLLIQMWIQVSYQWIGRFHAIFTCSMMHNI